MREKAHLACAAQAVKEMRGNAKREAVAILKKCNVLQFQGTAETRDSTAIETRMYMCALPHFPLLTHGTSSTVQDAPGGEDGGRTLGGPRCKLPVASNASRPNGSCDEVDGCRQFMCSH